MASIGNLICLTPRDSYVVDEPIRKKGLIGRLERRIGPFYRSPGIGFPYLVGFFRKTGNLLQPVIDQQDRPVAVCVDTELEDDLAAPPARTRLHSIEPLKTLEPFFLGNNDFPFDFRR